MSALKKVTSSVFLMLLFTNISLGQATIQGKVIEAESGEPLPGVNVYLAGTTIGQSTDKDGNYKIVTNVTGNYDLVFSFVGYKKQIQTVKLTFSTSLTHDIEMEEQVTQLEEIEVKTSNKKWQRQYDFFYDQFIGKNDNSKNVAIENPWVLNFNENNGNLIATAEKPIIIFNDALGYKLHVELVRFEWPKYRDQGGVYKIYTKFDPLSANGDVQRHKWKKTRLESYLGSLQHFLKCLYNDELNQHGFSINEPRFLSPLSEGKTKYELLSNGIAISMREKLKGFNLIQKIEVEFTASIDYQFNDETKSIFVSKYGGIQSNTEDKNYFVNKDGDLLNPLSLKTYGDWSRERVANLLPSNYSVKD